MKMRIREVFKTPEKGEHLTNFFIVITTGIGQCSKTGSEIL